MEATEPTIWGRLVAYMKGEVNTKTLEAYRRAGAGVYELIVNQENRRVDMKLNGKTPWTDDYTHKVQALCTWNAFVHQTLGDTFLDADYRADPTTVGYVPVITYKQALALYGAVEGWLGRARGAESNVEYKLDIPVPAGLPEWEEQENCPFPHIAAMVEALDTIHSHAGAALAVFEGDDAPADKAKDAAKLRQLFAEAKSKADYAKNLMGPGLNAELHETIERHAQQAIEAFYLLGQCLAMPELLEKGTTGFTPGSASRSAPSGGVSSNARPGEGFDPWCMTDPAQRERLKRDRNAVQALNDMWRYDPEPQKTLDIQRQIDGAFERGDIDYATKPNGMRIGHFQCTPYCPIYVVRRPVRIFGERLGPGQEFTIEIAADGVNIGHPFDREIVVGPFGPAPGLDYCDPNKPPPDDH